MLGMKKAILTLFVLQALVGFAQPESDTTNAAPPSISPTGIFEWAEAETVSLIDTALSFAGIRYRWGANEPDKGFDCSGFVQRVYRDALGMMLPHSAYSMSLQGKTVGLSDLKPGDLVFFNTLKHQFSHVGIYIGDNQFIHAPRTGKTVQIDNLKDPYWIKHYNGARRVDTSTPETPR
jgi:cell wall-associated NlpC family hydrolase